MAYKRQIDRLPIIPADAKVQTAVCHYCIVGCGYKAYTWDVNRQGGTAAGENAFGVDLAEQQEAQTAAWYSPSMYNIVEQGGRPVHLVIKPDHDCVVNSGLASPSISPHKSDGSPSGLVVSPDKATTLNPAVQTMAPV